MDFSNRSAQQPQVQPAAAPAAAHSAPSKKGRFGGSDNNKWKRIGVVVAIAAVVILIVAAIVAVSSTSTTAESKYVDSGKLQAVFLNTGQVYFGNIKVLNNKYVVLTNIYYLQTSNSSGSSSSSSTNSNVSLVKLGCELHEPYDQMVINRSQVTFWENLQDGGQVAKAVKQFEQANPNGQKCTDQSSSASTTSGNSAQSAGSSSTPSTSTSTSGH